MQLLKIETNQTKILEKYPFWQLEISTKLKTTWMHTNYVTKRWRFAVILNKLRVGKPEEYPYIDCTLKAWELKIHKDHPEYPKLYSLYMLRTFMQNESQIASEITLPIKPLDTGNLKETLLIKVVTRLMLSNNINIKDGLINGGYGTVNHFARMSFKNKDNLLQQEI